MAKWKVARVPAPVKVAMRRKLRLLTELLGWSTIDPVEDTHLVLSKMADIAQSMVDGSRMEIIENIRDRAAALRRSDDLDDLVAAGELDDLAADLEAPMTEDDSAHSA